MASLALHRNSFVNLQKFTACMHMPLCVTLADPYKAYFNINCQLQLLITANAKTKTELVVTRRKVSVNVNPCRLSNLNAFSCKETGLADLNH